MTSRHQLSVVVCSLGRADAHAALSSVISSAAAAAVAVEPILVWQAVEPPPPLPESVEIVSAFPAGLAYARNRGLVHSHAPIVAFLDDDERADERWAAAVMSAFEEGADAAFGPVAPMDDQGHPHCNFEGGGLRWFDDGRTPPWAVGTGGNMVCSRSLFLDLGGFDLRLGAGSFGRSAEDTDLIARLQRRQARLRWHPDMVVYHPTKTTEERLASRYPYGFGTGHMVRRTRSVSLGMRYGVDLAFAAREAIRRRSKRRARELAATAAGFASGAVHRDRWHAPEALLERMPAELRAALDGQRPVSWPVPHRADPHFLYAVGRDRVLHGYAEPSRQSLEALDARRRLEGVAGVPKLREAAEGGGALWVLEDRARGESPARSRLASWWDPAADWTMGLGAVTGPPLRETRWWATQAEPLLRDSRAVWKAELETAMELLADVPSVVVHGDLQRKNLMLDGSEVAVIDWEGAVPEGLPGLDLMYLATCARDARPSAAVVLALAEGRDSPGTPVVERLEALGLSGGRRSAALLVALELWTRHERLRQARPGVPRQRPQFEPVLRATGVRIAASLRAGRTLPA